MLATPRTLASTIDLPTDMKTNTTTAQPAGWTDAEVNAWIGDNLYPLVLIAVVALAVRLVIR